MNTFIRINSLKKILFCFIILFISACAEESVNTLEKPLFEEIEWPDLDPNGDKMIEYVAVESIGMNRATTNEYDLETELEQLGELEFDEDFGQIPPQDFSFGIVSEMNGKNVRIPGFIVPVEFEDENTVTGFFLVPYFGACFHEPPPPPNQTIYVSSDKPIEFESIYDPVWVMGTLTTERTGNDIANAEYKMSLSEIEAYTLHQ